MNFNICGVFFVISLFVASIFCDDLVEVYRWKQLSFANVENSDPSDFKFEDTNSLNTFNESFVPYNNLPMGVSHHKGRLFITVPRRRPGIPATLNIIETIQGRSGKQEGEEGPILKGYPDYITNTLHTDYTPDPRRIVSVYRTRVDKCERLWFVDTGLLEYPDNRRQLQRPAIWIIDLNTNLKVRRFEIPTEIVVEGVGMASITVDVETNGCDDAYAYIPDLAAYRLYVYSFRENKMWSFNHNYFRNEPTGGDLNVAGRQFNWDDGIFSITLGRTDPQTKAKPVYFHAMAALSEYQTTTDVLKNESLAASGNYATRFTILGERGANTQTAMHHFDEKTGIMMYSEVNRNSIGCWNSAMPFTPKNQGIVMLDYKRLIYPSDLTVDADGTMWVMTNSLPIWIYSTLDTNEYNFRIWRQDISKAVAGTICEMQQS